MSNLLHDDAAAREAGLLRAMALESQTLGRVADVVRGNRWMVGDLLNYEVRLTAAFHVRPVTVEQSVRDEYCEGDLDERDELTLREPGSVA